MKGVIYFELLDTNQTINFNLYSQQLQRLNEVLFQKRPALANQKGVILFHDNGPPHVAQLTQQKIKQLGWEILSHPPWSPDLAPSDYHLFASLRNYLRNKHYADFDELNSDLITFFESKLNRNEKIITAALRNIFFELNQKIFISTFRLSLQPLSRRTNTE